MLVCLSDVVLFIGPDVMFMIGVWGQVCNLGFSVLVKAPRVVVLWGLSKIGFSSFRVLWFIVV